MYFDTNGDFQFTTVSATNTSLSTLVITTNQLVASNAVPEPVNFSRAETCRP